MEVVVVDEGGGLEKKEGKENLIFCDFCVFVKND